MRQIVAGSGNQLGVQLEINLNDVFTEDFKQYAKAALLANVLSAWSHGAENAEGAVDSTRQELEDLVVKALHKFMLSTANEFEGPELDKQLKEMFGDRYDENTGEFRNVADSH